MFNLNLKGLSEPQLLFDFKLCAFGTQEVRLRAATSLVVEEEQEESINHEFKES